MEGGRKAAMVRDAAEAVEAARRRIGGVAMGKEIESRQAQARTKLQAAVRETGSVLGEVPAEYER